MDAEIMERGIYGLLAPYVLEKKEGMGHQSNLQEYHPKSLALHAKV